VLWPCPKFCWQDITIHHICCDPVLRSVDKTSPYTIFAVTLSYVLLTRHHHTPYLLWLCPTVCWQDITIHHIYCDPVLQSVDKTSPYTIFAVTLSYILLTRHHHTPYLLWPCPTFCWQDITIHHIFCDPVLHSVDKISPYTIFTVTLSYSLLTRYHHTPYLLWPCPTFCWQDITIHHIYCDPVLHSVDKTSPYTIFTVTLSYILLTRHHHTPYLLWPCPTFCWQDITIHHICCDHVLHSVDKTSPYTIFSVTLSYSLLTRYHHAPYLLWACPTFCWQDITIHHIYCDPVLVCWQDITIHHIYCDPVLHSVDKKSPYTIFTVTLSYILSTRYHHTPYLLWPCPTVCWQDITIHHIYCDAVLHSVDKKSPYTIFTVTLSYILLTRYHHTPYLLWPCPTFCWQDITIHHIYPDARQPCMQDPPPPTSQLQNAFSFVGNYKVPSNFSDK